MLFHIVMSLGESHSIANKKKIKKLDYYVSEKLLPVDIEVM